MSNARPAFALIRRCWKPLLAAGLIVFLAELAALAVGWAGEAARDRFIAETAPAVEEALRAIPLDTSGDTFCDLDDDPWDEIFSDFNQAAREVEHPYQVVAFLIRLLNLLLITPLLLTGLYRGLLAAEAGQPVPARALRHGLSRWQTVLRLNALTWLIRITVIVAAYLLCYWLCIALYDVRIALYDAVSNAVVALFIGAVCWFDLRLAMAHVHLAEDAEGLYTVTGCIGYAWRDAKACGIFGMLSALWPMLLTLGALPFVQSWLPASPLVDTALALVHVSVHAVMCCSFVCIYARVRRLEQPTDAHDPALAAGEP